MNNFESMFHEFLSFLFDFVIVERMFAMFSNFLVHVINEKKNFCC